MFGQVIVLLISGAGVALLIAAGWGVGSRGFGWPPLLGAILGAMVAIWGIVLFQAGGSLHAGWRRWRRFATVVATWQVRLLYSAVYVLLVIPLGVLLRWRSDPLRLRRAPAGRTCGEYGRSLPISNVGRGASSDADSRYLLLLP